MARMTPRTTKTGLISVEREVLEQIFGLDFVTSLVESLPLPPAPPDEATTSSATDDGTTLSSSPEPSASTAETEEMKVEERSPKLSPARTHLEDEDSEMDDDTEEDKDGPSQPKSSRKEPLAPTTVPAVQDNSVQAKTPPKPHLLSHLGAAMKATLQNLEDAERLALDSQQQEGKLGPSVVKYDVESHVGSFVISTDRLGVVSQCNFGSIRATSCVYSGRWQYEVQLGTNGVMQVGWATLGTKFSQEKGVGDTADSYAFDGNRLRKWNKSTAQYGEPWQAGDIIGCCIDLDAGLMEFYRNGKSLGVAFKDIRRGPKVAYFPAVSLAYQENVVANFGATPLQYSVDGYSPLQRQRTADNEKCSLLLSWLSRLLPLFKGSKFSGSDPEHLPLYVIANRIVELLGPHLHSAYVVEQSLFPFFAVLCGLPEKIGHNVKIQLPETKLNTDKVELCLSLFWGLLEDSEMKSTLEKLVIGLMNQFRSNSLSLDYPFQKYSLLVLSAICSHRRTRRHIIRHLLLDRSSRLVQFLHVRPTDDSVLTEMMPTTDSNTYEPACRIINREVQKIQRLQVDFMKILLDNSDGNDRRPTSRSIFLRRFRHHVRDVIRPGSVLHQPVQKAICTFFCFLKTISELYTEEVKEKGPELLPSLPAIMFYDTTLNYSDMERLGGLSSYLYKTYHAEVSRKIGIPDYLKDRDKTSSVSQSLDSNSGGRFTGTFRMDGGSESDGVTGVITVSTGVGNDSLPLPPSPGPATPAHATPGSPQTPFIYGPNMDHPRHLTDEEMASVDTVGVARNTNTADAAVSANSSTESGVGVGREFEPPTMAHFGVGALIAGTPSGHNMMIPMMTDFHNMDTRVTLLPGFMGFASLANRTTGFIPHNPAASLLGRDKGRMDTIFSLRELLDDAIIVFNAGVSANVEKAVSLRETVRAYETGLDRTINQLSAAILKSSAVVPELQKSSAIFRTKLDEQRRQLAWVQSAVFTDERQTFAYELLKMVLGTLNDASSEGPLFAFVPEHYITTLVNLNWLLLIQMHPTVPYTNITDLPSVLSQVAEFIALHFADPRIIIAETKDTLTQALNTFICDRIMLTALESMPSESQKSMIKSILRPYENRAWAQSNWMLVRIWQGDGFAFQYPNSLEARQSYRAKPAQDEFGIFTNLGPTPSKIFQNHVAEVLMEDQKFAIAYIHSVLNQLNWAFSEFVGLLQEIQTAGNRAERVFVESRQLKICGTCFELTQALLRVMEMVINVAAPILTDFTKEMAESLLARLAMLMSQIINRIGSNTGCFAGVVELDVPGLENVSHFPILSAVAGILVGLVRPELGKTVEQGAPITKTLLEEPSFQASSLEFFLGRNQEHVPQGRKIFSLADMPDDVSTVELADFESMIVHLTMWTDALAPASEVDDDDVCTICYAYPKNATLKPCGHRTCKSCVLHHLMNRGECFFCKAVIEIVMLDDGTKIHDITENPPNDPHEHRRR